MNHSLASLLFVILSLPIPLYNQIGQNNYFTENYIFQERLAKGLVFDILQDRYGLMWFGTEYGLVRYDGRNTRFFVHEPGNPYSLAGNVITALAEDEKGGLWIGTQNSGLHYYDRAKDKFQRYQANPKNTTSISHNKISDILIEDANTIWVTTVGGGTNFFRKDLQRFTVPNIEQAGPSSFALFKDADDQLWMGNFYGLNLWVEEKELFERYAQVSTPFPAFNSLKVLALDHESTLWAGFRNGGIKQLSADRKTFMDIQCIPAWPADRNAENIWDIETSPNGDLLIATDRSLIHLKKQEQTNTYSLSEYQLTKERRVLSLYKTADGVLWVGTNDGIMVLSPRHKIFRHISPLAAEEPKSTKRGITSMTDAEQFGIWMGTIKGLWKFDQEEQNLQQDFLDEHPLLQHFAQENISALLQDSRGFLWLAIIKGFNTEFSLYRYDFREKVLDEFSNHHPNLHSFAITDIHEDTNGDVWIANHGGLIQFDWRNLQFKIIKTETSPGDQAIEQRINLIMPFDDSELLLGTNSNGVYLYLPENQNLRRLDIDTSKLSLEVNPRILDIAHTEEQLWIGTSGGLFSWDKNNHQLEGYDQRHGLFDNVVKVILQDKEGQVWVATQGALAKWVPHSKSFTTYDEGDGLIMGEFWDRSYFGGDDGLLIFDPKDIQNNSFHPPLTFTQFDLFNRPLSAARDSIILPSSIEQQPEVHLKHHQNVFTIHYAALSFINPEKNQYEIKMEGFQDDWQMMGAETQATYTNLNPGTYFFRVKASNNDGIWNEEVATLKIVVYPPWYWTWWAIATYVILFGIATIVLYNFQLQRKFAQLEARRLHELDTVKTELYTHITHEFRTPLSLIQGPIERALSDQQYQLGQKELAVIKNNCKRLLKLIEQVLNLNKLEANAMKLKLGHGDIIPSLKFHMDAFSSFASSQNIKLQFSSDIDQVYLDFDPESLSDIISNLLLNACKYTPSGGKIQVQVNRQLDAAIHIAIKDTGRGIPDFEIDRVFDPFYQVKNQGGLNKTESIRSSTGIGLSMAKQLAELMDGQLTVTSEVGVGSCFTLTLPIRNAFKDHPNKTPSIVPYVPPVPIHTFSPSQATMIHPPEVLVVDDNIEMANFIANCLPKHFKITLAYDGDEGVTKAQDMIPDLIISDVMMPKIDGFELTETLKKDVRSSHIPIILLTAKTKLGDRLQGLKKGSEVYLTKPFHQQELLIQVENILDTRRRLQEYYLSQSGLKKKLLGDPTPHRVEDQFLQKVRRLIETKTDTSNYSVEALAKDLHLSPSQLYRKMIALTGQSTSKFFRGIQLHKAIELLLQTDLNISEIAYRSGFSEPAYFSRVFTAEKGLSPSQFREQNSGNS